MASRIFAQIKRVVHHGMNRTRIDMYNIGYRVAGSLDGLPFPPARLVDLVIGTQELAWYQLGGLFMHQTITTIMRRHGAPIETQRCILDFGCGCGRITRWWAALGSICEIWGSDYNPDLVEWCVRNLSSFAQFRVNQAKPPLDFPDDKFDFVYAYSVFTHFASIDQLDWFVEIARVLKPGGLFLVTVHGERVAWRMNFSPEQLEQLQTQGILVFGEERAGENYCSAYHSEAFMSGLKEIGLSLIDYMPGGVRDSSEQDIYLLRKLPY